MAAGHILFLSTLSSLWHVMNGNAGYAFCSLMSDWSMHGDKIDYGQAHEICTERCNITGKKYYSLRREGYYGEYAVCYCEDSSGSRCSNCNFNCGGPCGGGGETEPLCVSVFSVLSSYPHCTDRGWDQHGKFPHGSAITDCTSECRNKGFSYAGVQRVDGSSQNANCFCGHTPPNNDGSNCHRLCDGLPCGRDGRMSTYPACLEGYYGFSCVFVCPGYCQDYVCQIDTGECAWGCVSGYYGNSCENNCSYTCTRDECRQADGYCEGGCRDYYYGDMCEFSCSNCIGGKCQQSNGECEFGCFPGFYGDECESPCPQNCQGNTCQQSNGHCTECTDGWYTPTCNVSCPTECTEQKCDITAGLCSSCNNGWYGERCTEQCPRNCNETACEFTTGLCLYGCKPGFFNATCEMRCPVNCANDLCDKDDGVCSSGCDEGFFDKNCTSQCPVNCIYNNCTVDDGLCHLGCDIGFYTFTCTKTCPEHCHHRACDFVSGACKFGCIDGWNGTKCEEDINECEEHPEICADNMCVNIEGSFLCNCSDYTNHVCDGNRMTPIWVGPVIAFVAVVSFILGYFVNYSSIISKCRERNYGK